VIQMRIPKQYYNKRRKYQNSNSFRTGGEIKPVLAFQIITRAAFSRHLFLHRINRDTINRQMRSMYKKIIMYTKRQLVGNPRVGNYGKQGLVPKGGTGDMRLFTRAMLDRQYNTSTIALSPSLYIGIPVHYAKDMNQKTTSQLRHSGKGRRIVGYSGSKPIYDEVNLYDPEAGGIDSGDGGFFQGLVIKARQYSAILFKKFLNSYNLNRDQITKFFILEPNDFSTLIF